MDLCKFELLKNIHSIKKRENFTEPPFLGKIFFKIQDSIFLDRVEIAIIFSMVVLNEDLQETNYAHAQNFNVYNFGLC